MLLRLPVQAVLFISFSSLAMAAVALADTSYSSSARYSCPPGWAESCASGPVSGIGAGGAGRTGLRDAMNNAGLACKDAGVIAATGVAKCVTRGQDLCTLLGCYPSLMPAPPTHNVCRVTFCEQTIIDCANCTKTVHRVNRPAAGPPQDGGTTNTPYTCRIMETSSESWACTAESGPLSMPYQCTPSLFESISNKTE